MNTKEGVLIRKPKSVVIKSGQLLSFPNPAEVPGVSVITCTNRTGNVENILGNYLRQDYYPRELTIVLNNNAIDLSQWKTCINGLPDIKVFQVDEQKSLGECLNFAVAQSAYNYIAKFDDDDYYAPEYLKNAVDIFKYTDAGVVGKGTYFTYFKNEQLLALISSCEENAYVRWVAGPTLVVKREVFLRVKFQPVSIAEDITFLNDCFNNNIKIYSADKFNFVYIRNADHDTHTWKADKDEVLNSGTYYHIIAQTNDFKSYITT